MKMFLMSGLAVASVSAAAATATIREGSVSVSQDAGRRVRVSYTLDEAPGWITFDVLTNGVSIGGKHLASVSGDVAKKVAAGNRSFVWNPLHSWPDHIIRGGALSVKVTAWDESCPPPVLVVDLLLASNVTAYAKLEDVPGGPTDRIYKTDKLLLRKIPAGNVTYRMGSPTTEASRNQYNEKPHSVTLTKDFYLGVYEVTQKQWYNVSSARPSWFSNEDCWETRPVEKVAYGWPENPSASIRASSDGGAGSWPSGDDPHKVGSKSFFGILRRHSGLDLLDLPTDAQWEYACRAGTPGPLNDGTATTDTLPTLARYRGNSGYVSGSSLAADVTSQYGTAEVGSYLPNAWGLYDMHGNVSEWVLDRFVSDLGTESVTDPGGTDSDSNYYRGFRGGSWREPAKDCRNASRGTHSDSKGYSIDAGGNYWDYKNYIGFRVCLHMP